MIKVVLQLLLIPRIHQNTVFHGIQYLKLSSNTGIFRPGSEATVEAGTKHWEATDSGCGACAKDKADANICKTVSSAMGLSALLLPLVAAIYTLF